MTMLAQVLALVQLVAILADYAIAPVTLVVVVRVWVEFFFAVFAIMLDICNVGHLLPLQSSDIGHI